MSSILIIVGMVVAGTFGCEALRIWRRDTAWRRSLKREALRDH